MKSPPQCLAYAFPIVTGAIVAADVAIVFSLRSSADGMSLLNSGWLAGSLLLFAAIGALIVVKGGSPAVGWATSASGLLLASFQLVDDYSTWSITRSPVEPWSISVQIASGARQLGWMPGIWGLVSLALFYPTGRYPSSRWKRPYLIVTTLVVVFVALGFVMPLPLTDPLQQYENPLGIAVLEPVASSTAAAGLSVFFAAALITTGNMLVRAWRSRGDEREQFKWFATAIALFVIAQLFTGVINDAVDRAVDILSLVAMSLVPASIGIAILKYRLYDIDLLLSKTFVYAPLTAILGGIYAASIPLIRILFLGTTGKSSEETTVLTTVLVVALSLPVKSRIQSVVDKLFKEDERQRLQAYASEIGKASDMLEARTILSRFARLASVTVDAPIRIIIDAPAEIIEYPEGAAHSDQPTLIPLEHQSRVLGRIEVSRPRSGQVRPSNVSLIRNASTNLARITHLIGSNRSTAGEPTGDVQTV